MLNESRVILKSFIIVMPSFIYQKDNSCIYNWEGTSSLCLDHLEFLEKWQLQAANLQNYYISFYAFIENNILQFHIQKNCCITLTILILKFIVLTNSTEQLCLITRHFYSPFFIDQDSKITSETSIPLPFY